jgi:hypothetical protein
MKTYFKLLIFLTFSNFVLGQVANQEFYSDRILVCLQPDAVLDEVDNRGTFPLTGLASLDQLLGNREVVRMEKYLPAATPADRDGDIILSNIYRLILRPKQPAKYMITEFEADGNILFAEPEAVNRLMHTPNDPLFNNQWHLPQVGAPAAWDFWDVDNGKLPGDKSIILASVDTGVLYTHPDLWRNIWVNQQEVPIEILFDVDTNTDLKVSPEEIVAYVEDYNGDGQTNLQDALHPDSPFMNGEDNNSGTSQYVDDLLGWDAAGATTGVDPDNDPTPPNLESHGTHVAGILAATSGNDEGVASVMYNGRIMAVKTAIDSDASLMDVYAGVLYAAQSGADIINCSWGSESYSASSQSVINVVVNTYGAIVVAAAGNGNDDGTPTDRPHYPSGYDNVVSVTALGPQDNFSWANYGANAGDGRFYGIDIAAPGEGILSTIIPDIKSGYQAWNGTSMASPLVASCIGLLKARYPSKSNDWIIETLLSTADPIDDINPNYAGQLGSGRVNIRRALERDLYPSLSITGQTLEVIDNDNDGRLSPGEEGMLTLQLTNEVGWDTAEGVTTVLRSPSEYVTILDSLGAFANLGGGQSELNSADPFGIQLSADAPSANFSFVLEVRANSDQNYPYVEQHEFTIENINWQTGFPAAANSIKSGVAIVDLDADGEGEIIYTAADSMLHIRNADGSYLAPFPIKFGHKATATPAVGDLDQDRNLEIVVGSWDRNLYVVQHDGTFEAIYQASSIILAPPALYDLDNDGDLEIVLLSYGKQIVALHHDGTLLPNFPIDVTGFLKVGSAIGDINADGSPDIIVGTLDDQLHAFNTDGSSLAGFPVNLGKPIESAPVLANMDGDAQGTLEILFGSDASAFHAYDANGVELWKTTVGGRVRTDAAMADVDADGDLEVVFGAADGNMYLLDHEGVIQSGWPVQLDGVIKGSPTIVDLNRDGSSEIFIGTTNHWVYGLTKDGGDYFGFPIESYYAVEGTPAFADLDRDQDVELVIGTNGNLMVADLTGGASLINNWPTHRGNLRRTGTPTRLIPVSLEPENPLPLEFTLSGNYPNPFNASTQIKFSLAKAGPVRLEVIDIRGRVRDLLIDDNMTAGSQQISWNATFSGVNAEAGVYLYRLTTTEGSLIRKMTLIK